MEFKIIVLLVTIRIRRIGSKDDFPKLEDLFPTLSPAELEPMKNINVQMEEIDLEKFQKKLDQLETQLIGNATLQENSLVDARRQALPYHTSKWFRWASDDLLKVKSIDLMLQHIYMARYQVRAIEREGHFKTTDTAYRIAFLYRRLRRHWRRIMDLYTMQMKKNRKIHAVKALRIHQKMIKLYEEYMYMWWLLIQLDGKYLTRLAIVNLKSLTTIADEDGSNSTDMDLQDDEMTFATADDQVPVVPVTTPQAPLDLPTAPPA